jgi:hypothetical protein
VTPAKRAQYTFPEKQLDQSTTRGMLEIESQREIERIQKDRPQP